MSSPPPRQGVAAWLAHPWGTPLLVAVAALLVRLPSLRQSLWADEFYTVALAHKSLVEIAVWFDQTPPLNAMIVHLWASVAGFSEAAVRFPSALAGSAAAGLTVLVARRFLQPATAVLAGLLVAVQPTLVSQAAEARPYALLAFLGTLSWWLWLRLTEGAPRRTYWAYVVVGTALVYAHVFGWLFLAGQGVAWLVRRPARPTMREMLAAFALVAVAFAPWAPSLYSGARYVSDGFWIGPTTISGLSADLQSAALHFTGSAYLLLLHMLVWTALAVTLWRPAPAAQPNRILAAWAFVPIALAYAASYIVPVYRARYAVPAAVGYLVLVAWGLQRLNRPLRRTLAASLLVLGLLVSVHASPVLSSPDRNDWRGAVAYIDEHAAPGEKVVLYPGYCDSLRDDDLSCPFTYYSRRADLDLVPFGDPNGHETGGNPYNPVRDRLAGARSVWLIEVGTVQFPDNLYNWLHSVYPKAERHDTTLLYVVHFAS